MLVTTAFLAIFIASAINSLVKMVMASVIGGSEMRRYVIGPITGSVCIGAVSVWLSYA